MENDQLIAKYDKTSATDVWAKKSKQYKEKDTTIKAKTKEMAAIFCQRAKDKEMAKQKGAIGKNYEKLAEKNETIEAMGEEKHRAQIRIPRPQVGQELATRLGLFEGRG